MQNNCVNGSACSWWIHINYPDQIAQRKKCWGIYLFAYSSIIRIYKGVILPSHFHQELHNVILRTNQCDRIFTFCGLYVVLIAYRSIHSIIDASNVTKMKVYQTCLKVKGYNCYICLIYLLHVLYEQDMLFCPKYLPTYFICVLHQYIITHAGQQQQQYVFILEIINGSMTS